MHTIFLRADIEKTAVWQQALLKAAPSDFQLQRWATVTTSMPPVNGSRHANGSANGSFHANGANGSSHAPKTPSLLLHLTDLADLSATIQQYQKKGNTPVIYAGPVGNQFQIGPGVIEGQTTCPACLQQQSNLFPGMMSTLAGATAVALTDRTIGRIAARLMAELVAFVHRDENSRLRRGYLLRLSRQPRRSESRASWQIYRGLRDPYCESCSLYAHYPSEAIYIK